MRLPGWTGTVLHALAGAIVGAAPLGFFGWLATFAREQGPLEWVALITGGLVSLASVPLMVMFGIDRERDQHPTRASLSTHQLVEGWAWGVGALIGFVGVLVWVALR